MATPIRKLNYQNMTIPSHIAARAAAAGMTLTPRPVAQQQKRPQNSARPMRAGMGLSEQQQREYAALREKVEEDERFFYHAAATKTDPAFIPPILAFSRNANGQLILHERVLKVTSQDTVHLGTWAELDACATELQHSGKLEAAAIANSGTATNRIYALPSATFGASCPIFGVRVKVSANADAYEPGVELSTALTAGRNRASADLTRSNLTFELYPAQATFFILPAQRVTGQAHASLALSTIFTVDGSFTLDNVPTNYRTTVHPITANSVALRELLECASSYRRQALRMKGVRNGV